ncbi:MAG: hypothetical protein AB8B91_13920 [Rubripirellula sp.]
MDSEPKGSGEPNPKESELGNDDLESLANALDEAITDANAPSLSNQRQIRRRRHRLIGIATGLAVLLVGILLWSGGYFSSEEEVVEVLTIAPDRLFEQLCADVRKNQAKKFHVTGFKVSDSMMSEIADLDWVETFIIDQGELSGQSMETIAKLSSLQHLRLRLSPVDDAGMEALSKCKSLWYLNLPHAECTSKGVAALRNLPRLRQLRLGSKNLNNDVTREIAAIGSLRGIHLIGVPVTDEGLKTLAVMPHLESLYLDDSAVTEAGWDWLFQEHPHLHVHINQSHHDRDPKHHAHH